MEMQGIEFQIVNDSSGAASGLDKLTASLSKLKSSLGSSGTALSRTAKGIKDIKNTLSSMNTGDFENKLGRISRSLETLNTKAGSLKLSSSIGNQLTAIGTALNAMPDTTRDKLTALAEGLAPLSELGKSNLGSFTTQLEKLPAIMQQLDAMDMDKFADQMQRLSNAMAPFASQMQKVSTGFSSFPSRIQRLITSTNQYNGVVSRATNNTNMWGRALKTISLAAIFRGATSFLASAINKASEYQEDLNLFTVSMGEYAQEAYEYAQKVSEVVGIDPAEWMRNQGVFNSIITGFGVAGDKAAFMSKNLTQLGYDLSSFYNLDFESAMQKVQSGIAGELEPLRRLGYDLSVARLEQEALNLGITKSVSAMNQAEKAQLRYYAMMTQVTQVQGDMARTLENPANMLRILRAQLEQASRAIGNLFIPVLTKVLPIAIAVASALREIIAAIAALFGVELKEPVWDNAGGIGSSIGDAAEGADDIANSMGDAADDAKKLKQYLAGFDELNVMPPETEDSLSSALDGLEGIGSGDLGIELPGYDFLEGAVTNQIEEWKKKLEPFVNWVKDDLKQILITIGAIGAGLLAWKIGNSVMNFIARFKDLVSSGVISSMASGMKTIGSIAITVAGAFMTIGNAVDAWVNGVDWKNLLGMLSGIGIIVAGLALKFGTVGAAIGLVVGGVSLLVVGIHDWVKNGELATETFWMLEASIAAIGGGIALLTGSWIPLVVAAVAGIGLAIYKNWDEIKAFFAGIGEWFNDNVIQPIVSFFEPAIEWIKELFRGCWIVVQAVWQGVSAWFNGNVVQPVVGWFRQLWQDVSGYFSELWSGVMEIWSPVADWFNKNVIQPVVERFSSAWKTIQRAFEVAFNAIGNVAKAIFNGVIARIEGMVNRVISGINSLVSGFNRIVDWAAGVIGANWGGLSLIPTISLPRLAEGGYVDEGQLFIAREAGAEMVGSIGRRTAVANNDQITEGVADAVFAALMETGILGYVKSIADSSERTAQKEFSLGKPSSAVGRWVSQSVEAYDAVRG